MLYQILILAGLSLFMLNLTLNLATLRLPRRQAALHSPAPLVSVLVPARDEAGNIGACLESLMRQDYPSFEVVVVDDNSEDDTAAIVFRLAARDSRIRLVSGQPLPEGWAGKPFACLQAARQARGQWLLFVDADTVHTPDMLRRVIALAMESGVSMLSGFPRQLATSLAQKTAIPMMYFVVLAWAPLWWLHRSKRPLPSVAVGQFLLFPAEFYWRMGGHAAVSSRIMEDVWLGVEVTRHGGRHLAVDLSPVVACHMYDSVGAMWEGIVKWNLLGGCHFGASPGSPDFFRLHHLSSPILLAVARFPCARRARLGSFNPAPGGSYHRHAPSG